MTTVFHVLTNKSNAVEACGLAIKSLQKAHDSLAGHQGVSTEEMRAKISNLKKQFTTTRNQLSQPVVFHNGDGKPTPGGGGGGF